MTAAILHRHILAIEVVGPTRQSPRDLDLSLAILTELLESLDVYLEANAAGKLVVSSFEGGILLEFLVGDGDEDQAAALPCVLELYEMLQEVPLIPVRMALHAGIEAGLSEVRPLLESAEAGQILVSKEFAAYMKGFTESLLTSVESADGKKHFRIEPQRLVILGAESDPVVDELQDALDRDGHEISRDGKDARGVAWAKSIESRIRSADAVVAIVSGQSAGSELLQYQLEIAVDERRKRGRPHIVPVWLSEEPPIDAALTALQQNQRQAVWTGQADTERVVDEVRATLADGQAETDSDSLDASAHAGTEESARYIRRSVDEEFDEALQDQESIILVKGPRQIGKRSLMAGGVRQVDEWGWRCATTDFQRLSSRQMESEVSFYRVLAATLCRQVGFDFDFEREWMEGIPPALNMDEFMSQLLASSDRPLVWFMEEADRLFSAPFASEFYGLVRSWHNARSTRPRGPWGRFTAVIGYATEAHLFIKDLNQSPFNVGCRIDIPMFSLANTSDLNERYGTPIRRPQDVEALQNLLGGQPFLTRRALEILASGQMTIETLLAEADQEDGPFSDHLKRILVSVTQLRAVWDALVSSLSTPDLTDSEGLQRLVAAGILVRKGRNFELVCELYKRYLARHRHMEVNL